MNEAIQKNKGDDLIQRRNWKQKVLFALIAVLIAMIVAGIARNDSRRVEAKIAAKAPIETTRKLLDPESTKIRENLKEQPTSEPLPESTPEPTYTEEELYMMSHLIGGEAGASWASDIHQQAVGLIVMNRVNSHLFPNTLEEVIFQKGQYACTWDGNYDKEPSEQVIENAKRVLTGDTDIEFPANVVFQSTSRLGDGVYYQIYDEILNNTTYFCYSNK